MYHIKKPLIVSLAIFIFLTAGVFFIADAQKLPKIQQVSQRAPSNIKIDGKTSEWGNQFMAYNSNLEVFYTISNDDKNVYLALQAVDPLVIRKIINAGLAFTINTSGNKNDKSHNISVEFPVFDRQNWPTLNIRQKPVVTKDSSISSKQVDSFMYAANQQISTKAKEIKVLGIAAIGDTLISVYNDNDIKASAQFDHKIAYNFELALPVKYLGLSVDDQSKFIYNIQLNGAHTIEGVIFTYDAKGNTTMHITVKNPPSGLELEYMKYPTDFWGEYTLTKK